MTQKMQFLLDISADAYQYYYQGRARFVQVRSVDGRTLRFPASELQQFVSRSGVRGRFEIEFNDRHKLVKLSKI